MHVDELLCPVFDPVSDTIRIVRMHYFKPCHDNELPSFSSLVDGISRQVDLQSTGAEEDVVSEDILHQDFLTSFKASARGKENTKIPS